MSCKLFLVVALVAASVVGLSAKAARSSDFEFDCSGLVDGNYPHPTLCTHYVACVAQAYAYEMPCAMNLDGSLLHYVQDSGPDPTTSRCDYPEVAGCSRDECDAFAKTISAKLKKIKSKKTVNVVALEEKILALLQNA